MVVITKLIMIGIAVVCAITLAFILFDFIAYKVSSWHPGKTGNFLNNN